MTRRYPPQSLDAKGRCCGVKPIVYKREPHLFCHRCARAYDPATGKQIPNWAWLVDGDGFRARHEHLEARS